jgi:uncharacterized RDD family membrane protein YckC
MSRSGGPGSPGQPPPAGPPDWQQPPQQPAPPAWQQTPQQPAPPAWQQTPQQPAPPAWQQTPQQPAPPAWQQTPQQPVAPAPPPPPPSWTASLTSTAPVVGPAGFYYADVPNRIIAYIIDVIILAIIGFVVAIVVGGVFGGVMTTSTSGTDVNVGAFAVVALINLAVGAAYFVWLWSTQRATVGMRLLGLQVGDEGDGRTISTAQAFNRWLIIGIPSILSQFAGYVSAGLGFVLSLVGFIWLIALLVSIAQSPTKQGYHDRFAKTIMVKAARRAA